MTPLESALLVLVLALPPFWWLHRRIAQISDPDYLRRHGVIIVLDRALEAHSAPIAQFMGRPVWGTVTFKGMLYRFDHVLDRRKRERLEAGQLFIEPGLVYVLQ